MGNNAIAIMAEIYKVSDQKAELIKTHEKALGEINAILGQLRTSYAQINAGLDIQKVDLAKTIISVRGTYTGAGDQTSCVRDFVKWLVTGKANTYQQPPQVAFGTKNYDGWSSQRCDCEKGYGPRHGSINFAISTSKEWEALSEDEREAGVYFLENLQTIQSATSKTEAA